MDLFNTSCKKNILPFDGITNYHGKFLNSNQCAFFYNKLMDTIDWKNDEAIIFGKKIITKRKVAWYGESKFSYTYSKITKTASLFTKELLDLKEIIEEESNATYNSCLLNLYHNGQEGMSWHSDGEKVLKKNGEIASVTLGAERKFSFKHKRSRLSPRAGSPAPLTRLQYKRVLEY